MRRRETGNTSDEFPTIISDLDGNIIYVNRKAYVALYPIKVGDSVEKFVPLDHIRKLSLFENRVDVIAFDNGEFKKLVLKTVGSGATKTVELYFMRMAENSVGEIQEDRRLLATFGETIGNEITGMVKLNDFLSNIAECMHRDLRFAYRRFSLSEHNQAPALFVNFAHLCTIAVGTIMALNDIEYRNPIEIRIDELAGEYVMSISVDVFTFKSLKGLHDLSELYPRVAMRLMYITLLCENDDIKYEYIVKPNKITASFFVNEMINKTGRFSALVFGQEQGKFVKYIMNMFDRAVFSDTTEEEQE